MLELERNQTFQREVHASGDTNPKLGEQERTKTRNNNFRTAFRLLQGDAMGLTQREKQLLFTYLIWENEPQDIVGMEIPEATKIQAIDSVTNGLFPRYKRLKGMIALTSRVEERLGKKASVNEFDFWVWEMWNKGVVSAKVLVSEIPPELDPEGASFEERIRRVNSCMKKLRDYQEVTNGFKKKRRKARQKEIATLIASEGLSEVVELAERFGVTIATIGGDLKDLRRKGSAPEARKQRSRAEKNRIAVAIRKVIKSCEVDGRSYARGDIGPAEIARILDMKAPFVTNFIKKNRDILKLPQRANSTESRRSIREVYKRKIRALLQECGELPASKIYYLLLEADPKMHFTQGTIEKLKREAQREDPVVK